MILTRDYQATLTSYSFERTILTRVLLHFINYGNLEGELLSNRHVKWMCFFFYRKSAINVTVHRAA